MAGFSSPPFTGGFAIDDDGIFGPDAPGSTLVGLERPIAIITDQEWASIGLKAQAGPPRGVYWDRRWTEIGSSRLWPWPIPDGQQSLAVVLYSPQALTKFADYEIEYSTPPGYAEALFYQLLIRLAPIFGGVVDGDLKLLAKEALARVKRKNLRPVEKTLPPGTPGTRRGGFDWRTG